MIHPEDYERDRPGPDASAEEVEEYIEEVARKWQDSEMREHLISEMSTEHLKNAISYIERNTNWINDEDGHPESLNERVLLAHYENMKEELKFREQEYEFEFGEDNE